MTLVERLLVQHVPIHIKCLKPIGISSILIPCFYQSKRKKYEFMAILSCLAFQGI